MFVVPYDMCHFNLFIFNNTIHDKLLNIYQHKLIVKSLFTKSLFFKILFLTSNCRLNFDSSQVSQLILSNTIAVKFIGYSS